MLILTINKIPDQDYEVLGLVKGSVVHSIHVGFDLTSSFKTIAGGEIKSYTEMLTEAREIATNRMIEDAEKLGANAIICTRYSVTNIIQNTAEVLAYGTAVKIF